MLEASVDMARASRYVALAMMRDSLAIIRVSPCKSAMSSTSLFKSCKKYDYHWLLMNTHIMQKNILSKKVRAT